MDVAASRFGLVTVLVGEGGLAEGLGAPSPDLLEPVATRAGFGGVKAVRGDAEPVIHGRGGDLLGEGDLVQRGEDGFQVTQRC